MNTRRATPSTWVPHVKQKPRRRGRIAEPLTQDGSYRDCSVGIASRVGVNVIAGSQDADDPIVRPVCALE